MRGPDHGLSGDLFLEIGDRPVELGIPAFKHGVRILFDDDVRLDAGPFDDPVAVHPIGVIGDVQPAAVDQAVPPPLPTSPPQVRTPITGPSFSLRKMSGNSSPFEPLFSLITATLWPGNPQLWRVHETP